MKLTDDNMLMNRRNDHRVSEEAASWLDRLAHDDSPECHADLDRWLRESPVNVEELFLAQAIWTELGRADPGRLARLRDEPASTVIQLHSATEPGELSSNIQRPGSITAHAGRPRRRVRHWLAAAAASVAAIVFGWLALAPLSSGIEVYGTDIGGQQAITLSDGSIVLLNTDSRVEIRFDGRQRGVRLVRGEALFTVAHDATRAFVVETDNTAVRAVGTRFNVHRANATDTRVAVIDGVVQVSSPPASAVQSESFRPIRLTAGDEVKVIRAQAIKVPTPDVQRAVSWRGRRLIFSGDRVADIADEFNRYNRTKLRVEGTAARDRKVSGVFDADDPAPLLKFLSQFPDIIVTQSDNDTLIRSRAPADADDGTH